MFEITINHEDSSKSVTVQKPEVVIARKNEFQVVDLDLTPDDTVSRVHARVALVEAGVLLEDLNSSLGTTVNGLVEAESDAGFHRLVVCGRAGDTYLSA